MDVKIDGLQDKENCIDNNVTVFMDIKVDNYDVLYSGCVTSVAGKDVLFVVANNIKVRLMFTTTEDKKQTMTSNLSNGELSITLQNFNNPLGTEFTDAIEIGKYQGRRLLLHIRVLGMEATSNRVILHTWFLGDNISNG